MIIDILCLAGALVLSWQCDARAPSALGYCRFYNGGLTRFRWNSSTTLPPIREFYTGRGKQEYGLSCNLFNHWPCNYSHLLCWLLSNVLIVRIVTSDRLLSRITFLRAGLTSFAFGERYTTQLPHRQRPHAFRRSLPSAPPLVTVDSTTEDWPCCSEHGDPYALKTETRPGPSFGYLLNYNALYRFYCASMEIRDLDGLSVDSRYNTQSFK